ncbi:uncharacterized protein LOC130047437 [Ostrea edulis]|uniref:uncharacterized protein LOC130047437 n=1 Tax=Ostrea edulis TaxID=37623 RepID=UPI0024AFF267|nr:uncharacterized protein LOC130047437 [Ostrea edulis]
MPKAYSTCLIRIVWSMSSNVAESSMSSSINSAAHGFLSRAEFSVVNMCETEVLITTGEENTQCLVAEFESSNFEAESFLISDSTLRIRDCRMGNIAQDLWLCFTGDINGIVGILNNFPDITAPFSYISILPRGERSLIDVYPISRKDLPLQLYNSDGMQYLKWTKGFKCLEGDGFDFHFTLLPRGGNLHYPKYNRREFQKLQYAFHENFRKQLSNTRMNLDEKSLSRSTMKKNVIFDIRKLHVLPDDREFILNTLDKSLQRCAELKILIYVSLHSNLVIEISPFKSNRNKRF